MNSPNVIDSFIPERNLEHWVCFDCRKMFKRPSRLENDGTDPRFPVNGYACPQCNELMINMGLYFDPPRRSALAAWSRLRLLAEYGYFYYTEGSKFFIQTYILSEPPPSVRVLRKRLQEEKGKSLANLQQRHDRYLQELKRERTRLRRAK